MIRRLDLQRAEHTVDPEETGAVQSLHQQPQQGFHSQTLILDWRLREWSIPRIHVPY
jgi:hypothetical protein